MKNLEKQFIELLQFKNKRLTEGSKVLIEEELSKNKFLDYFKIKNGTRAKFLEVHKIEEVIYFLNYILTNYLDQLSDATKLDLYKLLLGFKMENNECHSGLKLISELESKFANDLFILNVEGNLFRTIGWYNEALETFYKALDILSTTKNEGSRNNWLLRTNHSIAIVYTEQKEFESAIKIFEENLEKQKENLSQLDISASYMNLGHLYGLMEDFDKAIFYNSKAQDFVAEFGDKFESEKLNINMAEMYINSGNMNLAEKFINLCKKSEYTKIVDDAVLLELRVKLYNLRGERNLLDIDKMALNTLVDKALKNLENSDLILEKIFNYTFIANAFDYLGNKDKAIEILKEKYMLYEAHVENQKLKSYEQIRAKHEFQLQRKELKKKIAARTKR